MCHHEDYKIDWRPTETDARGWCERHGFEYLSWDGIFCSYRDPRRAGTPLEFGLESHIG